jgi:hypothetical protein
MSADPIHRTIDGKKYYVRLVTLTGSSEVWTADTGTLYFASRAKCQRYIDERLGRAFIINPDTGTLTRDRRRA